jgi:hypothetical protein
MVTFYDSTVPNLQSALASLRHILQKAEAYGKSEELVKARIADDMNPLTFQVFEVCSMSEQIQAMLQGQASLNLKDDMTSFGEFYTRIDRVTELVDKIDKNTFNLYAEKPIELEGKHFKGADIVRDEYMPHLWFHLVTAYDILRKEGIPVGKKDFTAAWTKRFA